MKALVTGGGGFLGRYVAEQLKARGDEVAIFGRGSYPELVRQGFSIRQGDLEDAHAVRAACQGADAVFHVAAKTSFWGKRAQFHAANVAGTANVVEACRAEGVKKLIYTSSPSVIFDGTDHQGVDEAIPYPERYENFYGETKAIAERMVIAANTRTLSTVSLRPHAVFGPRDSHLLPRIIEAGRTGRLVQIGDGNNRSDFTYVEDAALAHLLAADALGPESPVAGSVYFISQDEPVLIWPFLREIFGALGIPPPKRAISLKFGRRLGSAVEFAHRLLPFLGDPLITRTVVSEAGLHHYYDISRAKRDFGYRPRHTMAEALARTLPHLTAAS